MERFSEIFIRTFATPPCDSHNGWISLAVDDIRDIFTDIERRYFECEILSDDDLTKFSSDLVGYEQNGGVYDYMESLLGIEIVMPLSPSIIDRVRTEARLINQDGESE